MDCCQCQGIEREFDDESVRQELEDYHAGEVGETTQWLIDAILEDEVDGSTLLDIGGGVGAIQHQLLEAGVKEVVSVDASTAYFEASQKEADRRGIDDRISFQHGNFVDLAPELKSADIVTMDRVVCCYHNLPGLLGSAAEKSDHMLGLVFPNDKWWFRFGVRLANAGLRLQRNPFRVFAHPVSEIERITAEHGFRTRSEESTRVWHVRLYERP